MSDQNDPNIGSNRGGDSSLSGLVSTLVPVAVVSGIYIIVFLILRRSQRRYYAPRTYLGSIRENERSPALPTGLFNWFGAFWKIPDTYALQHQSLDAFLFLRFMRIVTTICFVGCCILWPILFPVNATGGGGQEQLNILSYSNINTDTPGGKNRFYAHCFAAWLFYGFVMYMVLRECIYYINLRQAFLLSPLYANRISSRTVLFVSVPAAYLDESRLRKVFGEETVKNIWITGDTKELEELVKERDKVAMKLEKAEVKLLKLANGERLKSIKKGGADERAEVSHDAEPGSLSARWVPNKKRPTHRLGALGLVGKKVDTINWCRSELERLIPEVDAAQTSYRAGSAKKIPSVFIEFFTQFQAESANQVLAHHQALQMTPKYIGITPGEVVWSALKVSWWQRVIRRFAVIAFIAVLIIFWAVPVGVVGIISNVEHLKTISFLTWLDKIPQVIMGVVSGLLPSVALSILMSLVPVVMRLCARLSGEPSLSRVELFTQNAYFAFQVIQVFLITTMTSAATAVAKQIYDNPASVTMVLAQNLPKASNIFIPYFIVQGLGIASNVLSQVVGFVIFTLMYKFLTGTPRAMYTKWASLSAISWGSIMPVYTNIVVISLCYAAIAPLVVGFATIGLGLFYLAWRYNVLFVTDTTIDTRGLIYPRALKQLFAGIYIAELCMIGLFGASVAIGPLILMIIFTIFTALFHITINSALDPLLYNLPRSLESEESSLRLEAQSGSGVSGVSGGSHELKNGHSEPKRELDGPATTTAGGKKPGLFSKFFKPWNHCDYATLRSIVPTHSLDFNNLYTDEVARNAYYPPRSTQEVRDSGKVIPITDEGCILNDKNKLEWDTESVRPPLWEEKIYY
ncbi:uncharacterized protein PG986_005392 [Apiospora aurea]|uniref:Uncharacterized protein n=1 Tax=Apiospora aurea TaxID=335848 RepID=A0ABR1QHN5_9PEZI